MPVKQALFSRVDPWLPPIALMGLIFFLSSQPSLPRAPDDLLDLLTKKGAHFGEYLVLAILLARALAGGGSIRLSVIVLALGIEHLWLLSHRS